MGQRGFAADSDASARTDEASQKKDIKQDTGMEENSEEAAERGTETEQDTEEFPPLNSDGVGCIILAPEEEDTFADKCGFGGCEPFYSYSHPESGMTFSLPSDFQTAVKSHGRSRIPMRWKAPGGMISRMRRNMRRNTNMTVRAGSRRSGSWESAAVRRCW